MVIAMILTGSEEPAWSRENIVSRLRIYLVIRSDKKNRACDLSNGDDEQAEEGDGLWRISAQSKIRLEKWL